MKRTLWLENSFGERFLFQRHKALQVMILIFIWYRFHNEVTYWFVSICSNYYDFIHRFFAKEIRQAANEIRQEYDENVMGKVALSMFLYHNSSAVTYNLSEEA